MTLVFGAMQDKAIDEMLRALAPAAATIVCTTCGNDEPSEFMTEAELEEMS